MRAKDIHVGGEYWTKVGEERVKVRVVMTRKGGAGIGRMGKFQVERVDNGNLLPKWRSAQALHPVGEGPWPGVMQKQEYPGLGETDVSIALIVKYLRLHGPMSGRDIVDDLEVDEADVTMAEQEGFIKEVKPPPDGVSPWYAARPQSRKWGFRW